MKSSEIVKALAALAQESRLAIYRQLVERGPTGVSAGEIGAELKVVPATLSFHLKELSHAGLITSRQEGRYIYYSANFDEMNALVGYLTDNCCARDGVTCGAPATCAAEATSAKKSKLKSQRKGAKT